MSLHLKNKTNTLSGLYGTGYYSTAAFIVIFIAVFIFTAKTAAYMNEQRNELAQNRAQTQELVLQSEKFAAIKHHLEDSVEDRENLNKLLPTKEGVLQNIQILEQAAEASGNSQFIRIVDTPPDSQNAADKKRSSKNTKKDHVRGLPQGFTEIEYEVSLNGNFRGLYHYLRVLESQPFLHIVNEVSIRAEKSINNPERTSLNTGQVSTSIKGWFYVQEENK